MQTYDVIWALILGSCVSLSLVAVIFNAYGASKKDRRAKPNLVVNTSQLNQEQGTSQSNKSEI